MEREFPSSSFLDSDRVPCGSRYRRWIVSLQLPQNISGSTALSGELRVETRTESKVQRVLLQGGKISIYFKKNSWHKVKLDTPSLPPFPSGQLKSATLAAFQSI